MSLQPGRKHHFYAELAKLTGAGFGIREAAAAMRETHVPAAEARVLDAVDRELEAGRSISAAFASSGSLGPLENAILAAGERGGRLSAAFQHLSDYFAMVDAARRHALRALIYPAVLLHLGIFIGTVPLGMLGGGEGNILRDFVVAVLVAWGIAFLAFLAIRALLRFAEENAAVDHALNRIPFVGAARRNMAMARFTRVCHTCVLAALSMSETMETAARASRSGMVREAGMRLAGTAREGDRLGPAILAEPAFPKSFARSYATAEEAGGLDKDLARWSRLFEENAAGAVRTLAVMGPKVIYFGILAYVAWKIISFWSNYYRMLDGIGS